MIIVTTNDIPNRKVAQTLGIVRGSTIRARHVGRDILAGLRNVVGGEIHEYVKLMGEAREQAIDRMVDEARKLEGDAILGVRFATSMIMTGAAELMVYGTAVKLED